MITDNIKTITREDLANLFKKYIECKNIQTLSIKNRPKSEEGIATDDDRFAIKWRKATHKEDELYAFFLNKKPFIIPDQPTRQTCPRIFYFQPVFRKIQHSCQQIIDG